MIVRLVLAVICGMWIGWTLAGVRHRDHANWLEHLVGEAQQTARYWEERQRQGGTMESALQHNRRVRAPGTFEAQAEGCRCPRLDNGWEIGNRRWGIPEEDDQARWIVVEGCPLHDRREKE